MNFATNPDNSLARVIATERRLWEAPRSGQTQSGYGSAIPTTWMVRLRGFKGLRRVYCVIHSNIGTLYVKIKGQKYVVDGIEDAPHVS